MPGITKPPVLKSFILCGRGGQKESEEAKGCSCELQNHEGKHKQMSKKEALAKKKKKRLNLSPYFKYLLKAEVGHPCRWIVSSSSKLIYKGRLLSAALQLSGFCHS